MENNAKKKNTPSRNKTTGQNKTRKRNTSTTKRSSQNTNSHKPQSVKNVNQEETLDVNSIVEEATKDKSNLDIDIKSEEILKPQETEIKHDISDIQDVSEEIVETEVNVMTDAKPENAQELNDLETQEEISDEQPIAEEVVADVIDAKSEESIKDGTSIEHDINEAVETIIETQEESQSSDVSKENKEVNKEKKQSVKKTKKKMRKRTIFKICLACFIWLIILAGGTVAVILAQIGLDIIEVSPDLSVEDLISRESSIILDSEGNVIAELGEHLRDNVEYEQLPQSLIDAFVSIEDSRFFEHNGFDVPRFTKALQENLQVSLEAGEIRFVQGGSTLTMQLIDNAYYLNSLTELEVNPLEQKVQEIYLAYILEQKISKEDIFTHYVNKLNFGGNIRGVEKASQYYFNKNVSQLNISESALLAGIVNLPNTYNPYQNLDYATERRDTVLDLMFYHGYISQTELDLAKSIRIENQLVNESTVHDPDGYDYQAYIDEVINEVMEITGEDPSTTPMTIYSNMDREIQEAVELVQNEGVEHIQFYDELQQTAIVITDNTNGQIIALGGGKNYQGERMFNRATDMYNQPGSSVKPFLSYALAFEHLGWATSHVVVDRPVEYRGTATLLNNFDGKFRGDMTLEDAIGTSMNTPAYLTLEQLADTIGHEAIVDYLNDIGMDQVTLDNFDLGYAIGGSNFEVTPVQLGAAHSTLINHGEYIEPHTVSKIEFADGRETLIREPETNQAISPAAAYMAAIMMEDTSSSRYFNYMQILRRDYPVYAKTGTTDWGNDGVQYGIPRGAAKDKWMVFSTSKYTSTLWFGYDQAVDGMDTYFNSAKSRLNTPGEIQSYLLDILHPEGEEPPAAIEEPEGLSRITHILGTYPYATGGEFSWLYTTGLIKEEFNNTINVYSSVDTSLNGISIQRHEGGDMYYTFATESLATVDGKKNISLYSPYNTVEAFGNIIFDYAWVTGQPHYVVKVFINGAFSHELYSDSPVIYDWSDQPNVRVCGYYYTDNGLASNEVCSN